MVTEPYDCSRAREWPDLSEAGSERAQGPSGRGVLSNQDHEQPGAELILFPGAIGMFKACELSGLLPEYITSVPFGRRAHVMPEASVNLSSTTPIAKFCGLIVFIVSCDAVIAACFRAEVVAIEHGGMVPAPADVFICSQPPQRAALSCRNTLEIGAKLRFWIIRDRKSVV